MNSVLTLSSQLVLFGICCVAIRRAFLSHSSNWIVYALAAVAGLYAVFSLVVFARDIPLAAQPMIAAAGIFGWLLVRRICERRRTFWIGEQHSAC